MKLATITPGARLYLHDVEYSITEWVPDTNLVTLISDKGVRRELDMFVILEHYHQGSARPSLDSRLSRAANDERATARKRVQKDLLAELPDTTLERGEFCMRVLRWVNDNHIPLTNRHHWEADKIRLREDLKIPPDAWVPGMSTVKTWRVKHWAASHDPASLVPRYHLRGGKGTHRLMPEIDDLISLCIDNYFLTPERYSARSAHEMLKGDVEAVNKHRSAKNQLKIPGYSTFMRRIRDHSAYEICEARYGRAAAQHRFRSGVRGFTNRLGFMDQWQMDHAVLDVIVIDRDTGLPLGRPRLTLILEASTRMCMGFTVGLDGMSSIATLECLKRAILPKNRAELQKMGVKGTWNAFGIPLVLNLDNGSDYHSRALRAALLELGIEVQYCPRKKAWFKGGVERAIQTFNRQGTGYLPGSVVTPNLKVVLGLDKDSKLDPAKMAVMDLEQLNGVLHRWLIDQHLNQPMKALKNMCPAMAWDKFASPERLQIPEDVERLALYCTIPTTRTITHTGISLCNVQTFNSPELQDVRRSNGDRGTEVNVRYSPRKLDRLWFQIPATCEWVEVTNPDPDTNDLSEKELKMVIAYQKQVNYDSERQITFSESRKEMAQWAREMRTAGTLARRRLMATILGLSNEAATESDLADQLPRDTAALEAAKANKKPVTRLKATVSKPAPAPASATTSRTQSGGGATLPSPPLLSQTTSEVFDEFADAPNF